MFSTPARVVHRDIDPAVASDDLLDHRFDLGRLADIARDREGVRPELGDRGIELGLGPAADRDLGAEPHEFERGREPNSGPAAGH